MKIFGYGSLMNQNSLKKSFNEFKIVGVDSLEGYYRIFNFKSPDRHNKETGEYSSVLNLNEHADTSISGVVIEIPQKQIDNLMNREKGYDCVEVMLNSGEKVHTFLAKENTIYNYIFEDSVQKEYLDMCLSACKSYGYSVYKNFITTTFLQDGLSVEEYLIDKTRCAPHGTRLT
jgi:hypothetical protein